MAKPSEPVEQREAELRELMDSERPVRARELAEQLLSEAPESFVAHLVLGWVFYEHETNFPRAHFHLRHALEHFEGRCGSTGERCGPEAWRLRASTLIRLVHLSGDMDRRAEELRWLDVYEQRYNPKRYGPRAWALMKLGRFDEARQTALAGIAEASGHQLDGSWTALCAVESEAQRFAKAYETCRDAALRLAKEPGDGTVEYRNAGHAALTMYRFAEAERLYHEATQRPVAAYSNPWADLAGLYAQQGRLAEAVSALGEARRYVRGRPPAYVFNDAARLDRLAAEVLLALGRPEEAQAVLHRAALAPDRLGGTSAHSAQEQAATWLMLTSATLARSRALAAEARVASWGRRPGLWWSVLQLRLQAWRARRRVAAALVDTELLVSSARPLHPRGLAVTTWLAGDMVAAVGSGVVRAALSKAATLERRAGTKAYFAALRAEAHWQGGHVEKADEAAAEALTGLPRGEVLLRGRCALVRARAARHRGDDDAALSMLDRLLRQAPAVMALAGEPLPVRVVSDGSHGAERLADILDGSPMLREHSAGLRVQASASGLCLFDLSGARHACAELRPARPGEAPGAEAPADSSRPGLGQGEPGDPDRARDTVIRFLEALLRPRLNLSQAALRSLDGSTTSGDQRSEAMRELIDRITEQGPVQD